MSSVLSIHDVMDVVDNGNTVGHAMASALGTAPLPLEQLAGSPRGIAVVASSTYDPATERIENEALFAQGRTIIRVYFAHGSAYIVCAAASHPVGFERYFDALRNNQEFHDAIIFSGDDRYFDPEEPRTAVVIEVVVDFVRTRHGLICSNPGTLYVLDRARARFSVKSGLWSSSRELVTNEENALFSSPNIKVGSDIYRVPNTVDLDGLRSMLIDPEFGVANHAYYVMNSDLFPMYCIESMIDSTFPNNAYGRAATYDRSKRSALFEALERFYNASNRQGRREVLGSYNRLSEYAVDPVELILHPDSSAENPEFTYRRYSPDASYPWMWSWSIRQESYTLVPSQYFHYHDSHHHGDDDSGANSRFVYECSNGAALGATREEALLHSLLETIERDNFLACFYTRLKLNAIDLGTIESAEIQRLILLMESRGYQVFLFDISLELEVPAVWCLCTNTNDGAVVTTYSAAGCDLNPEVAINSALVEVATSIGVYETVFSDPTQQARRELLAEDPSRVTLFEDHVLLYSHPGAVKMLDYLLEDPSYVSLQSTYPQWYRTTKHRGPDLNDDLRSVVDAILRHYPDVLFADLSDESLTSNRLHCTKALVPGMLPMTFGMQNRRISEQRLESAIDYAARAKGLRSLGSNRDTPHPFP